MDIKFVENIMILSKEIATMEFVALTAHLICD